MCMVQIQRVLRVHSIDLSDALAAMWVRCLKLASAKGIAVQWDRCELSHNIPQPRVTSCNTAEDFQETLGHLWLLQLDTKSESIDGLVAITEWLSRWKSLRSTSLSTAVIIAIDASPLLAALLLEAGAGVVVTRLEQIAPLAMKWAELVKAERTMIYDCH
jgi:hypothetical protein